MVEDQPSVNVRLRSHPKGNGMRNKRTPSHQLMRIPTGHPTTRTTSPEPTAAMPHNRDQAVRHHTDCDPRRPRSTDATAQAATFNNDHSTGGPAGYNPPLVTETRTASTCSANS